MVAREAMRANETMTKEILVLDLSKEVLVLDKSHDGLRLAFFCYG